MSAEVEAILQEAVEHPLLGALATSALKMLSEHGWEGGQISELQSTPHYVRVWQDREKLGVYDRMRVSGVVETITSLEALGGEVRIAAMQSDTGGLIFVWVDVRGELAGLILGRK